MYKLNEIFKDDLSLIQWLEKENALPYVDIALTDELLKKFKGNPSIAPLLLHLSQATRAGHVCVKVNQQHILPKPEGIWEVNDPSKFSEIDWQAIDQLIQKSISYLSDEFITDVTKTESTFINTPLCCYGDFYYFQKHWLYESTCLLHLERLQNQKPSLQINSTIIQASLNELLLQNSLLPEQAAAITQLEEHSLTIISGGPGTGKTYTAGLLIKIFWNALTNEQRQKCRIVLCAPTGKAAANLQKSLNRAVEGLRDFPLIKAATLHSLLGLKTGTETFTPISADLLIVDECSMIDVRLMSLLLQALKKGARLIMLGDPFQLPPVEAGCFFSDMIQLCNSSKVELKQCLRSELKEIVDLSKEIKNGSCQAALHLLTNSRNALHFNPIEEETKLTHVQHLLWKKTAHFFKTANDLSDSKNFNHFRILSPLRKGPLGVDQLNTFFYQEMLKQTHDNSPLVIPIMICSNDRKRELFNGDVGFLVRHKVTEEKCCQVGDYALIGEKKIPALLLPRYEYAYCLSVHKSQGSEFDHVLLLLPEGSARFGREMVYTGVTRARQKLEIWSSPPIFESILKNSSMRVTRFKESSDEDVNT